MEKVAEKVYDKHDREYTIAPAKKQANKAFLFFKRLFDILASLTLGVILLLPMLIVAIIIVTTSEGSALYRQERLGKGGKSFYMLKFRTMFKDSEKDGPVWAEKDDERCTSVGRFLRNAHLDELPQLWNILVGEMSFVGPRPERPFFYDEFESYIHGFKNRLAVKPGLTGFAQINGGYDLLPEEKIVYDMEYIEKQSLGMDLKCLFGTVKMVFTGEGVR